MVTKETKKQLNMLKLQRESFHQRWFARDNFVYDVDFVHIDADEIEKKPIAECASALIALHIACAHNAVLESSKMGG